MLPQGRRASGLLRYQVAQKITWDAAVASYITDLKASGCAAGTCYNRTGVLRVFARFHRKTYLIDTVSLIAPHLACRFAKLRRNTAAHEFSDLRHFYDWAALHELIRKNPLRGMRAPRLEEHVTAVFADNEIRALLRTADAFERAVMLTLLATGMRISELVTLKWVEVERGEKVIKGKGGRERRVVIPSQQLWGALSALPKTSALVFPVGSGSIQTRFWRLSAQTGIHVHAHKFRHTYADRFLEMGGAIDDLSTILGHSELSTTMVYLKARREARGLAAQQRLNVLDRVLEPEPPIGGKIVPFRLRP